MAKINSSDLYQIDTLGSGTYGKVYKIRDKKGTIYALKKIESGIQGLKELGELTNLKRFDHPNIIKCMGFTVDKSGVTNKISLGIILPLGIDMYKIRISRCHIGDVLLTEWFYQLISAVNFMHRNGFYHCDIKPENILLVGDQLKLADLGLVGKKDLKQSICQSYPSPQLLLKRESPIPQNLVNIDVFRLESTEYQDDVWAIGQTFYVMLPYNWDYFYPKGQFAKGQVVKYLPTFDAYISDWKYMLPSAIPQNYQKYLPLLTKLLDPIPKNRDFSLSSLLDLDIFKLDTTKERKTLVDGTMAIVNNQHPVVFFTDSQKDDFKNILLKLLDRFTGVKSDLPIQACDLLYRTYQPALQIIKSGACTIENYIKTLEMVVLKINNRTLNDITINEQMKIIELQIIDWTFGNLSRIIISDYIAPDKYPVFLRWLRENFDKYENLSLPVLAQTINALSN